MDRKYRLTSSTDFKRVRRTGKSYAHPLAVLVVARNDLSHSRFGVTASRALGKAVSRNRARRRLREALRSYLPEISPGWDVVLIARPDVIDAEWTQVQEAVGGLLRRARLLSRQDEGQPVRS